MISNKSTAVLALGLSRHWPCIKISWPCWVTLFWCWLWKPDVFRCNLFVSCLVSLFITTTFDTNTSVRRCISCPNEHGSRCTHLEPWKYWNLTAEWLLRESLKVICPDRHNANKAMRGLHIQLCLMISLGSLGFLSGKWVIKRQLHQTSHYKNR